MTAKQLLIVVLILFALSAGSLLVYNFFFKTSPEDSKITDNNGALPGASGGTNGDSKDSGILPGANNGQTGQNQAVAKIKAISAVPALSPTIGENGQTVKYYSRLNGNVFESDFDGNNLKTISSTALEGLIKIIWSPDKEKVIGSFLENDQIKRYSYNYANKQSAPLNANITSVAWSPDSRRIVYEYQDKQTGQNDISTADPNGSNWKTIFKTRLDDLIVEWPGKDKISLRQPPSGLAQGLVYAINSNSGDFSKVLSDLYGLNAKWSPRADKILYSSTDDRGRNPKLSLADASGTNFKDIKLSGLADKCVWSNDNRTIFCALPQKISPSAVWPDDYYQGLVVLADDFYRINLETGEKTKILGSSDLVGYDALELFLSPKEDYLFFVNKQNGLLYSLKTR